MPHSLIGSLYGWVNDESHIDGLSPQCIYSPLYLYQTEGMPSVRPNGSNRVIVLGVLNYLHPLWYEGKVL